MSVTELVLPNLRSDPVSLKELETALPAAFGVFEGAAGLHLLRLGYITHQNGVNVTEKRRPVDICEWSSVDSFKAFSQTENFLTFRHTMDLYKIGPPTLELFGPGASPDEATKAPVTQIIRLKNTSDLALAAGEAIQQVAEKANAIGFISERGIWHGGMHQLIVIGWQSVEELEAAYESTDASALLKQMIAADEAFDYVTKLTPLVEQPNSGHVTETTMPEEVRATL